MSDRQWKDALWNLLDVLRLRRITGRVALSAGLMGFATQSAPDAMAGPRVPVSPVPYCGAPRTLSSCTWRDIGRTARTVHTDPTARTVLTARTAPARTRRTTRRRHRRHLLRQHRGRSRRGRLNALERKRRAQFSMATPPSTYDPNMIVTQERGALIITPAQKPDAHFSGYVSVQSFDLQSSTITVSVRRAASGAATIFAAAIDSENWSGFRIEGGELLLESHTKGRVAAKTIPYRASQHRFLRLRMSSVAPLIVWETSGDGASWTSEYVETSNIPVSALRIALSAGTTKSTPFSGPAEFDSVTVERRP
jgi:hypothetical protein